MNYLVLVWEKSKFRGFPKQNCSDF